MHTQLPSWFGSTVRVGLAGGALVLLLSGCVPIGTDGSTPVETGAPASTPSGPQTGRATAAPDNNPVDTPVGTPVTLTCEQLVAAQTIYDFNPNFGLLSGFTPAAGSLAAIAVAENGLACQWINQTSGETIQIAVADLPAPRIGELAATASSGDVIGGIGDQAYFANGSGQVFDGSFWVAAESTVFGTWDDAAPLVAAAVASLR